MAQDKATKTSDTKEQHWLKLIAHSAEGVLYHTCERDVFDLLKLEGFKKMHCHQVDDESRTLEKFKDKYIKHFEKLPIFEMGKVEFWTKRKDYTREMTKEEKAKAVKDEMDSYKEWEKSTLNLLLTVDVEPEEKKIVYAMIQDVIDELKFIEELAACLDSESYSEEVISAMNSYLYKKY
jgi:hypothetical protein